MNAWRILARLEGTETALVTGSGMGAISVGIAHIDDLCADIDRALLAVA